jgi:ketosteroid isomerase-like protein
MADNAALIQESYDGFSRGDLSPLLALLDENVEWFEAEHSPYWTGRPFKGAQATIEGVFARIPQDFDNFTITIRRILSCDDAVVVEARYLATSAKASGKPLDAQATHVWDFANGKIIRFQQYTDTWQYAKLTGVEPSL